jgi:hypothetical protein
METDRYKTAASDRRNLEETPHLADHKTPWLPLAGPAREMSTKRIMEVKNEFHASVGQDSLARCILNRPLTLERPEGFYMWTEYGMNWVFPIA